MEVPARLRPGEVRVLVDPRADHRLHTRPDARRCLERRVAVAVGPAGDDERGHVEAGEVLADRAVAPEGVAALVRQPLLEQEGLAVEPLQPHRPPAVADESPGRAAGTGRRASLRPTTAAPTGGSRSCSGCRRCSGRRGEDAGNEGRGVVAGVVGDGGDALGLASGETWASTVAMWQPMTRASRVSLSARTRV